jgi:hypothetical protein
MKPLFIFLISVPLLALQNGDFSGANYLSLATYSQTITDYRVDFRLSGFTINASAPQGIFGNNSSIGPQCVILQNTLTLRCRDFAGSFHTNMSLTGRPDVRVRFQRTGTVRLLEVWNADGSGYTSNIPSSTDPATSFNWNSHTPFVGAIYNGSQCTCTIGFVRWWSATIAAASPAPPDILLGTQASLADIELEGATTDSSTHAVTVTTNGGALSYSTTTTFAPVAVITTPAIGRAGSTAVSLSGSSSSNLYSDTPLTYFWGTPAWSTVAPVFSSRTSATPTVTMLTAGSYTISLTVVDAANSVGVDTEIIGAVATDTNSVLISTDTTNDGILGPMLKSGSSPWTWYDTNERGIADAIIATVGDTPGNTPLAGTISLTASSATVTGSSTTFQSTFNCNGTDQIMVHYPIAVGTGRRVYTVLSCASDTSMTITDPVGGYDAPSSPSSPSGVAYGRTTPVETALWQNGSNNWNYYDAVVALYRLYYRTGVTTYRDAARSLADKVYAWPFDGGRAYNAGQGYWMQAPRLTGLFGLMLRANDGQSGYWTGVGYAMTQYYPQYLSNYFGTAMPGDPIAETREQGYIALFTELMARLHPDAPTRATWATNSTNTLAYFVLVQSASTGSWRYDINPVLNYYGEGNLPWQGPWLMQFLVLNHQRTGASTALASIKAYADYFTIHGFDSSNDGGFYDDNFWTFCPDYGQSFETNVPTPSVSATNGGTTVTGTNTLFQTWYACNGTDSIGIQDDSGNRRAYTVNSCGSQTGMTIASGYGGATDSGLRLLRYPGAAATPTQACQISYGTSNAQKANARTLLNATHSYFGYLYATGQGAGYKTLGDTMFAENLGLGGPGNDGVVGHYADVLSGGSAPSYSALTYLSKEYAFAGGSVGAQPYLGWRIGGVTPPATTSFTVSALRSSISSATKLRVTVTVPSGSTYTNTCSADACTVTGIDSRQGTTGLMQLEYLSAGDAVLSRGEKQPVTVQ